MLDGLLQVGFDGPNGDAEPLGDFAVRQAFDPRQGQHDPPAFGELRNGTPKQIDLGTLLDLMLGARTVIRNIEQAIHFFCRQPAIFGAPVIPGDVERDLEQVGLGISDRHDLVDALDSQISFLKSVRGQIRRSEPARQALVDPVVVRDQQVTECLGVYVTHDMTLTIPIIRINVVSVGNDFVTLLS
jgi:hypothetical protein